MSVGSRRIPERLHWPVGVLSIIVCMVGITLGYVLISLGVTLYFDLNGFGPEFTDTDALVVIGFGVVAAVLGYLGWRGFLKYSY